MKFRSPFFLIPGMFVLAIALSSTLVAQTSSNPAPTASPSSQTSSAPSPAGGNQPATGQTLPPTPSQREKAERELKAQEQQRILGVVPNFNTSYVQDAAPLSPGQKMTLALRSSVDPFQFVAAALYAGYDQASNNFPGYGQGAQGYGKRFGAQYADQFSGNMWGNAIFPILLHEDPRYFRKGMGSIKSRLYYAVMTTFKTKNDDGTWGFNYANILGNVAAGGMSNLYYPSTDRGAALTFENAARVTGIGAIGAIGVEFWPDIDRKFIHKHRPDPQATESNK